MALAACACALGACSEDEKKAGPAGPAGPAGLSIVSPLEGEVLDLTTLPGGRLVVRVALENWTLRPPHACAGTAQCGYVVVRVDPTPEGDGATVRGATSQLLVDLRQLASPTGSHRVRVELAEDDGTPFEVDGTVLSAEVSIQVLASDAGSRDAAADAPDDDAGDAGASDARSDTATDAPPPDVGLADTAVDSPGADGAADGSASDSGAVDAASSEAGPDGGAVDASPAESAAPDAGDG